MRITNFGKITLGFCAATLVASCSIATSMDATIAKDTEAASQLKEEAKMPTPASNDDLIKVKDDIWLGNTSEIEYEGDPLPAYLEGADGIT